MLTLYDHIESPCCQKVRLVLAEKQIPFDPVWVDIEQGANLHPDYLALNPKAEVPVLVHEAGGGKIVLTESTIICEYLEDRYTDVPLFPDAPEERALARTWAHLVDMGIHVPHTAAITFTIAFREQLLGMLDSPETRHEYLAGIKDPVNPAVREQMFDRGFGSPYFHRALHAFDDLFKRMEAQLTRTRWLASDEFSYADIVIAPYVKRCLLLDLVHMLDRYPSIMSWYQVVKERESWRTEIVAKDAEFVAKLSAASQGAWQKVAPLLS